MNIFLAIASYLLGAIPFGLLFGKMAGVDVRLEGSKNIGATNVSRLLGKKLGLATLVCDCLKGYLPMLVAARLLQGQGSAELMVPACGVMAVLGHMFPVYLGFKGGRGWPPDSGFFSISPCRPFWSAWVFFSSRWQ